jgi:uncharacterized protein YydD (DUF2326 family)
MDVILRMSPDISASPNLPRSPIILVTNQMGRVPTACSGSVMRVHTIVSGPFCAQQPGAQGQANAVSETNLAVLFGLDAEVVRRFHRAKNALKQIQTAQKALRDLEKTAPAGTRRVDLEAALSAQIAAATLARDHLDERIKSFNVLPVFRELEQELATINEHSRDLSDEDVLDRESIDANRRALEEEEQGRSPRLDALFAEAKVVFPEIVNRRYEEVASFHHQLIENRQAQLQSEIVSAQRRIEERRPDREEVEVRRRQITAH